MNAPPQTLRVIMTADAVGGVWVFATTLARELCARGVEVTLVTLGPPPREHEIWELDGVGGLRLKITDLELEWMEPAALDLPRAGQTLTALDREVAPDIVHLNGYREACISWSAPVLVTAHSCVHSWWQACRGCAPDENNWDIYAERVKLGVEAADVWVAPTDAFRGSFTGLYCTTAPGRVINNGIAPLHGHASKEPFILAAGRLWDEAKNFGLLMGIAGDLDWRVRIAGAAHFPGATPSREQRAGAEIMGPLHRSHLLEQMDRAAVFAACPLYEPFGLTVLEAAASGCALVLSDIPTLRELWDGAALFADPRAPEGFRNALQQVCRNHSLRESLQRAASHRSRRYSLSDMTDRYCDLYRELACGAARFLASANPVLTTAQP
jgi:glycosyltransferase involved in cell wall biosynthesis